MNQGNRALFVVVLGVAVHSGWGVPLDPAQARYADYVNPQEVPEAGCVCRSGECVARGRAAARGTITRAAPPDALGDMEIAE